MKFKTVATPPEEVIEGLVDDLPVEQDPEKSDPMELISGLQDQLQQVQNETKVFKEEKSELLERQAKAIGFIEGSGLGKYDSTTGQIIKIEAEPVGPDPVEVIHAKIIETQANIVKQFKDGDITSEEYYQALQTDVAPLQDEHRDLKMEAQLNKFKSDITETVKPQEPVQSSKPEYDRLLTEYPDISDKNSPLFKKMNEIYTTNNNIYAKANQSDPDADPALYQDLIERSAMALKADGVIIEKQKNIIRNQFSQPTNNGYAEPKEGTKFSSEQTKVLVSQGIKSKALLQDLNESLNTYVETGKMVMND